MDLKEFEEVRTAVLGKTVMDVEHTEGGCALLMSDGTVVKFEYSIFGLGSEVVK